MTELRFWSIIEQSRQQRGLYKLIGRPIQHQQQIDNLKNILSSLTPDEVRDFDVWFHILLNKSYTWKLWAAAYIINGGCSDDGFDYFRSWLIGQGQSVFYTAVEDPESLKDVVKSDQPEDFEYEGLEYCAGEAYEKVTGEELEITGGEERPSEPLGKQWSEEEIPGLFPVLWKKFSHDA